MSETMKFESWMVTRPFLEHWFNRIETQKSGCQVWIGARDGHDYGLFQYNGIRHRASHVALQLIGVQIPVGHMVCHRCDRPSCVNPDHLFPGTARHNYRDARAKGRLHWQHPKDRLA